jgi:hypothetical protein
MTSGDALGTASTRRLVLQMGKGDISEHSTAKLGSSLGPTLWHLWVSQNRGCGRFQKSPRAHKSS